jgi:hypothetical protein
MADETASVLREIATLLRRQVEQHDATERRTEELRQRLGEGSGTFRLQGALEATSNRMNEARNRMNEARQTSLERMEKSREESARYREEDRHFKERLLAELVKQNHLLESLLAKLVH